MTDVPDIDFSSVTTSGEFEPEKPSRGRSRSKTPEKAARPPGFEQYWADARRSMTGSTADSAGEDAGGNEDGLSGDELFRARRRLIQKITMYYDLERHANRKKMRITEKTSLKNLKAELYDLENTNMPAAEMFFMATCKISEAAQALSYTKLNFMELKLHNLANNVANSKDKLMPLMQELSIKYSDWMIGNIWARLACDLGFICLQTHQDNERTIQAVKSAKVSFKDTKYENL